MAAPTFVPVKGGSTSSQSTAVTLAAYQNLAKAFESIPKAFEAYKEVKQKEMDNFDATVETEFNQTMQNYKDPNEFEEARQEGVFAEIANRFIDPKKAADFQNKLDSRFDKLVEDERDKKKFKFEENKDARAEASNARQEERLLLSKNADARQTRESNQNIKVSEQNYRHNAWEFEQKKKIAENYEKDTQYAMEVIHSLNAASRPEVLRKESNSYLISDEANLVGTLMEANTDFSKKLFADITAKSGVLPNPDDDGFKTEVFEFFGKNYLDSNGLPNVNRIAKDFGADVATKIARGTSDELSKNMFNLDPTALKKGLLTRAADDVNDYRNYPEVVARITGAVDALNIASPEQQAAKAKQIESTYLNYTDKNNPQIKSAYEIAKSGSSNWTEHADKNDFIGSLRKFAEVIDKASGTKDSELIGTGNYNGRLAYRDADSEIIRIVGRIYANGGVYDMGGGQNVTVPLSTLQAFLAAGGSRVKDGKYVAATEAEAKRELEHFIFGTNKANAAKTLETMNEDSLNFKLELGAIDSSFGSPAYKAVINLKNAAELAKGREDLVKRREAEQLANDPKNEEHKIRPEYKLFNLQNGTGN